MRKTQKMIALAGMTLAAAAVMSFGATAASAAPADTAATTTIAAPAPKNEAPPAPGDAKNQPGNPGNPGNDGNGRNNGNPNNGGRSWNDGNGRSWDGHRWGGWQRSWPVRTFNTKKACNWAGWIGEQQGRWDDSDCYRIARHKYILIAHEYGGRGRR